MTYAQINFEIFDHIKTRRTSRALRIKPVHLVGHLAALWAWATKSAPDGDLWQCEPSDIASAARWDGNSELFCEQLAANLWLIQSPSDPTRWAINDWFKHTGKFLEKSDKARKRKEKWIAKNVPRTFQERSENVPGACSENVPERPILDQIRSDQIQIQIQKKESKSRSADRDGDQKRSKNVPRTPSAPAGAVALAVAVRDSDQAAVTKIKPLKKTETGPSKGTLVFEAFAESMQRMGRGRPPRNAHAATEAKRLIEKEGFEMALKIAAYYPTRQHPEFVRLAHPFGIITKNSAMLRQEIETGIKLTKHVVNRIVRQEESNQYDELVQKGIEIVDPFELTASELEEEARRLEATR